MLPRSQRSDIDQTIANHLNQHPRATFHQPLGLIVGKNNAGKTRLMEADGYTTIASSTKQGLKITRATKGNATWLELPDLALHDLDTLRYVLRRCMQHCRTGLVDHVLMVIDVYDAISQPPADFVKWLKQYRQCLAELLTDLKQPPNCYVVFTHLDRVAGFIPTMAASSEAYWGYGLATHTNTTSLLQEHQQHFEQLLQALHAAIIEKLQHTPSAIVRQLIEEFPLQMESMGNMIKACINHLDQTCYQIRGIFFTAAQQDHASHDRITASIANNLSLPLPSAVPQSSGTNPCFVNGTLDFIRSKPLKPQQLPYRRIILVGVALLVSGMGLGIGRYHYTIGHIERALTNLAHFQQQIDTDNLYQFLPALSDIAAAKKSLDGVQTMAFFGNTQQLKQQVLAQYKMAVEKVLLPVLQKSLEQQLANSTSPQQSYLALKAYLMLGDTTHFDAGHLVGWVKENWHLSNQWQQTLLADIFAKLSQSKVLPLNIDHSVANNARNYLKEIAPDYLFSTLIFPELTQHTLEYQLPGMSPSELTIPERYTKTVAMQLLEYDIPQKLAPFGNDDWILGYPMNGMSQAVKKRFLAKYQRFWQQLVRSLQPNSFDDLLAGERVTEALLSQTEDSGSALSLIHSNTGAFRLVSSDDQKLFNQMVSNHFATIPHDNLSHFHLALQQALQLLNTGGNHGQSAKHAFDVMKHYFNQPDASDNQRLNGLVDPTTFAEPIATWIDSLNNNIVYILREQAKNYISQLWQQQIYQTYLDNISQKFPFSQQVNNEVSAKDFVKFFNTNGQLKQFIDTYLAPFIDTSQPQWHSKTRGGISLAIDDFALRELIRANIIRAMFFSRGSTATPQIPLTLHPLSLSPNVESLTMDLLGNVSKQTQTDKTSVNVTWPSSRPDQQAIRLMVYTTDGQTDALQEEGFWSLLKFLKRAEVKSVDNHTNQFQISLSIGDSELKYLLITDNEINPFIPGIMESFSLPHRLFEDSDHQLYG